MSMWLGVLGPLHVRHEDAVIPVPAPKQRVMLGALLVQANQVVSFEQLAEAVWDAAAPAGAHVTLRSYAMRLRRTLGPVVGMRIRTRYPGYRIDVGDGELDLLRFTKLFGAGAAAVRAQSWERAEASLGQALDLWRGAPLADIPSEALRQAEAPRLEQIHLQALEWRHEAQLHLGRHQELVPQLRALVAQQPLHERFHAQLMLGYYRCGRRADALTAYQDARRVLIDQLGVEPGPELRSLQQGILADDPRLRTPGTRGGAGPGRPAARLAASPAIQDGHVTDPAQSAITPRPRQLPPSARYFAGRASELRALDGLLDQVAGPGGTVVISAIGGAAGVGKSALALHWAHRVAERFPDGQLYANLRGFDPSGAPVTPVDAIRGFLDAFQVPPAAIPASPQAQVGLYRSLLARRSMLIVLDNARHSEQVRPLLSAGPGCLVVVTSRSRLTGLIASEGAHPITLDLLTEDEAGELLARRLGAMRLADEPEAAADLIRLCARLPLALSIAAARAATNPGLSLAAIAAELAEARLDALATGEAATDVRAVFSWSYQNLSKSAAHMFRLLGVHPGPDISAAAAASMAGLALPAARKALGELSGAHLIHEDAAGRFAFHDLLRAYAAEHAGAGCGKTGRRAAVHRMLDHYLHTAHAADRQLDPVRDPIALDPPVPGVTAGSPDSYPEALAWFQAEHSVLLGAVPLAAHAGFDAHAWRIPWELTTYLNRCGHFPDWAAVQRIALTSAERIKDQAGQAHAHNNLGRACLRLGARQDALAHQRLALALFVLLDDHVGQARSHIDLGRIFGAERRYELALDHASRALSLAEDARCRVISAGALNNIGWYHACLGDHAQTLSYCQRALGVFRELGHRGGEAQTLDSIGYAYQHLGQHDQAIACYQHALGIFRERGARYDQADLLNHLGEAHRAAGDLGSAREAWQQALTILDELHHSYAEQPRRNLQTLEMTQTARAT
jgi:DNA-binding SARP family transcriptional activator/Tfp pilus assembly protein PilF